MMPNIVIRLLVRKFELSAKLIHQGDDIFKYVAHFIFHSKKGYNSYHDKVIINLWIIQELVGLYTKYNCKLFRRKNVKKSCGKISKIS